MELVDVATSPYKLIGSFGPGTYSCCGLVDAGTFGVACIRSVSAVATFAVEDCVEPEAIELDPDIVLSD
jgi:hypothetical protein